MAHADSFRINISVAAMHRLTKRTLYVINAVQNINVTINEIFFVITTPYFMEWFEKHHPIIPIN